MEQKLIQRTLKARKRSDGAYIVTGKQLYESMKCMRRFVSLADCSVWATDLRELAQLYWRDPLLVWLPDLGSERPALHIETIDGRNRSRFFDRNIVHPESPTGVIAFCAK